MTPPFARARTIASRAALTRARKAHDRAIERGPIRSRFASATTCAYAGACYRLVRTETAAASPL